MKANLTMISSLEAPNFTINTFLLLKCMPYIHYLIQFKKAQIKVQTLIDFGSEINTINWSYIAKLDFKVGLINV